MTQTSENNFEREFFAWLKTFLKDKGMQFTQCGFKNKDSLGSRHEFDLVEGYWKEPSYSVTKPPRWLYRIIPDQDKLHAENPAEGATNLGAINSAQEDKAGVVFRIVPLIRQGNNGYVQNNSFEVHALFIFQGPTPRGSSSESINFDPQTGAMCFKGESLGYIACGLLGLVPRNTKLEVVAGDTKQVIRYGDVVDALAKDIKVTPVGQNAQQIPVFDLTKNDDLQKLKDEITKTWGSEVSSQIKSTTTPDNDEDSDDGDDIISTGTIKIPENKELLGISPSVYRQINAALKSGKQHIMLYGPPGTGKTTLARWIAATLTGGNWTLVTGSSDWSSQDIIGGYQPVGKGSVAFIPGVLLRHFDRPLIIDELNRCDIDKVLGPLFTVLSGQQTTLPYRVNIESADSPQYVILPECKPSAAEHEFAPGPHWRLITTINSIDKAALYQMSYALSRRFGWVYVNAPDNTTGFIASYLKKFDPNWSELGSDAPCPLGDFWTSINKIRVLGPAPIIDAIKAIQAMVEKADFFSVPSSSMQEALLDAVDMVLLPMLDGIVLQDAETLSDAAIESFNLEGNDKDRIKSRMASVAV